MFDSPKIIGYLFVLGQFLVSGYILYLVIRALKNILIRINKIMRIILY